MNHRRELENLGVERRMFRFILALALAGTVAAAVLGGWRWAVGFSLGAFVSYWNFRNLAKIVNGLGRPESTGRLGAFAWILFRFIVVALGAFVIIRLTQISIYAAFTGLFVSVAAVVLEALFELIYGS